MINVTPEDVIQEKQNRNRCMSLIKSKIRLRRPGFDWDQDPGLFEIYDYALNTMQDPIRTLAVKNVLIDSPFQPDPADIRAEYARLIGTTSDETPEETIARHEREQEYRDRLAREIEEKRKREHRPEMIDPEYRRRFLASRGSLGAIVAAQSGGGDNPSPRGPSSPRALPPPAQTNFQRRLLSCKTTEERKRLLESAVHSMTASEGASK